MQTVNKDPTIAGERTQQEGGDGKRCVEAAEHSTEGYRPERVEYLFGQIRIQIECLKSDYAKAIGELEEQDKEIARLRDEVKAFATMPQNEER